MFNKTSLLVDANNVFISTYAISTYEFNNQFYGGVLGFVNMLHKLLRTFSPDDLYIIWDGFSSRKKRQVINENYKNHRTTPMPYQLMKTESAFSTEEEREKNRQMQKDLLSQIIKTLPFYNIKIDTLEADDIIAKLSRQLSHNDNKVIIVSNDKDFYQLLSDNVSIYRSQKKIIYTKNNLLNDYNIYPENFVLARAIEGDKSDNLPGVKGAGLKTVMNRLPFFSKEKKITIDFLFEQAFILNQNKKLSFYSNLLNSRKLVEDNYNIMQLYDIEISPEENEELRSVIQCNPKFKEKEFDTLSDTFSNKYMMKNFKMLVNKYDEYIDYF